MDIDFAVAFRFLFIGGVLVGALLAGLICLVAQFLS